MKAQLTFSLPDERALLVECLEGGRWKQVVADLQRAIQNPETCVGLAEMVGDMPSSREDVMRRTLLVLEDCLGDALRELNLAWPKGEPT